MESKKEIELRKELELKRDIEKASTGVPRFAAFFIAPDASWPSRIVTISKGF